MAQSIDHGWKGARKIILFSSAARTTAETVNGTWYLNCARFRRALLELVTTNLATDVGDLLDVYVDCLAPDGTNALNLAHFTQLLGNGTDAQRRYFVLNNVADPGAVEVDATSDCAGGASRPYMPFDRLRGRYTITKDADPVEDQSFTFALYAYLLE